MKNLSSAATVALVQVVTLVLQSGISASLALGGVSLSTGLLRDLQRVWLLLRFLSIVAVVLLLLMRRRRALNAAIITANGFLTVGLLVSTLGLFYLLARGSAKHGGFVLSDVLLMAVVNILVFSIWYWIIDPPGIDESQPSNEPWEFLFTQRGNLVPQYESWTPRYLDYLHLAFTTSVAFSPTDTLPLTRRAKMLMNFQSTISLITIVFIAGGAINLLS
jgi:hypothetical protein